MPWSVHYNVIVNRCGNISKGFLCSGAPCSGRDAGRGETMDVNIDLGAVLKRAMSNGGEFADVFIEQSSPLSIVCEDSRIEKVLSGLDCGAGVRLIFGQRTAYAYTNDLTTGSLLEIADAVRQAAAGGIHQPAATLIRANPRVDLPV